MSREYCRKHHKYWDTDEEPCCPLFTYDDPCGTPYDPVPAEQITHRKGRKFGVVEGGKE